MTTEWAVPLVDLRLAEGDVEAVANVLRSGWLSMGPETERFEAELAAFTGSRHALAVANGTAALHLALLAAGIGPGDEVILPSLTFVATAAAVAYTGAAPVFADIQGLAAPWLSIEGCQAAIGERTAAILSVAYGGQAGEIEALSELAAWRGLLLLEDAAHASGSRLSGRHLGTFGKAGAFSFYANKNLVLGEGGAVITDDPQVAQRMRLLRSHGMTSLTWERHRQVGSYDVTALGFNYRIDEPRAALGRVRLARLESDNQRRRELDGRYRELLGDSGIGLPCAPDPRLESSCHLFTVTVPLQTSRDRVRAELAARGIQTSVHYPPVHRLSHYRLDAPSLPLTEGYAERTLTLPMFATMTDAQQDLVVAALQESLAKARASNPD